MRSRATFILERDREREAKEKSEWQRVRGTSELVVEQTANNLFAVSYSVSEKEGHAANEERGRRGS